MQIEISKIKHLLKNHFNPPEYRLSVLADIKTPPWGGANQVLIALINELKKNNVQVKNNYVGNKIKNYLLSAKAFNTNQLKTQKFTDSSKVVLHRIAGLFTVARNDPNQKINDDIVFEINNNYATKTIFQSQWSLDLIKKSNYRPVDPIIIPNAPDQSIFNTHNRVEFNTNRKTKLITTSWSSNPQKGGPIYKWLDENLNWDLFEYTFVGQISEKLNNIKHIPPVDSQKLSSILKNHDIFITASQNDAASNALLEGLACGLPVLYMNSGGNPELVKEAGISFNHQEEIKDKLEMLINKYQKYQNNIDIPKIEDVVKKWIALLDPES